MFKYDHNRQIKKKYLLCGRRGRGIGRALRAVASDDLGHHFQAFIMERLSIAFIFGAAGCFGDRSIIEK